MIEEFDEGACINEYQISSFVIQKDSLAIIPCALWKGVFFFSGDLLALSGQGQ
jgi:hypothetical protein